MQNRTYMCIDMKSFYASVECAELGLNPFETNLVVADKGRGKNALCLAITPKMKAQGVRNRCRLSEIPPGMQYITAMPRLQLYIDYAARIYGLYLNYFSPDDIHVYSIDECFIDVTSYLNVFHMEPKALAKLLMDEIAKKMHVPSTAGIGTNLYLCKIALDITAKHAPDHMGYLNEELYRQTLWDHRPITDFWRVARGTSERLAHHGIYTMRDITTAPEALIYKLFGKDAELLIDHAWGRESCLMEDIKNYRPSTHSISSSQILMRDYSSEEARIVLSEMVLEASHELMRRKMIASTVWVGIGYSRELHPSGKGSVRLLSATSAHSLLADAILPLYDRVVTPGVPIRRLAISCGELRDEGCAGYDFFTDWDKVEREQQRERAVISIKEKHGKNAMLRGTDFLESATQRERNGFIGGHKA